MYRRRCSKGFEVEVHIAVLLKLGDVLGLHQLADVRRGDVVRFGNLAPLLAALTLLDDLQPRRRTEVVLALL